MTPMKPLSETLTELGIDFSFPIEIKDDNGELTYFENINGWEKWERDANGWQTYFENSDGDQRGTPLAAKPCKGKVVEVDGIKYKLTAL